MTQYGKIAIFKNKNKITDKHPDYNGKITIEATMEPGVYDVSIYTSKSKNGLIYQSGYIKEEWKKPNQHQEQKQNGYQSESEEITISDDEIPF